VWENLGRWQHNEWLLLGHLVTARASDSVFLCIDFVRVTNCFYDYDYDQESSGFVDVCLTKCKEDSELQ